MFKLRNRHSIAATIKSSMQPTFTDNEIASMAGLGTLIDVAAGDDIMTEGSAGTHVLFLTEGTAAVSRNGTVIAMVSPGDMVGEHALVTGEPRNATVTALEAVKALQFDTHQFRWLRLESAKFKTLSDELVSARN